jgi:ABC-type dipeptide/oligopeptide/nickel transport system permease component
VRRDLLRTPSWVGYLGLPHGDVGTSIRYARPVAGVIAEAASYTAMLAGLSLGGAVLGEDTPSVTKLIR